MFILTIIIALALVALCGFALKMTKNLRCLKKLNAELHDRYALLWADYLRRGQRIMLYEAGMTKACVDELDKKVLARVEKFAQNHGLSES